MHRFKKYLFSVLSLVLFAFFSYSCGLDDSPLDENGQNYQVNSLDLSDADVEGTFTIDVYQAECDGQLEIIDIGPPLTVVYDDLETYTDVLATITITVAPGAPGITLDDYTIEYIPELSESGTGLAMPPTLDALTDRGHSAVSISSGTSLPFTLTCMTVDTKQEYFIKAGYVLDPAPPQIDVDDPPNGINNGDGDYVVANVFSAISAIDVARYTMRFTLYFTDEYGVNREIEVLKTIYMGRYDNC